MIFYLINNSFAAVKYCCILHGHVFIMGLVISDHHANNPSNPSFGMQRETTRTGMEKLFLASSKAKIKIPKVAKHKEKKIKTREIHKLQWYKPQIRMI